MSDDHDHDHDHAPIADGDEPPAAARVRALEALLVEKGVITREDVRQGIDWLVSRTPGRRRAARRARLGRSGVQGAPARRRARGRARARPRPGPVAGRRRASRTPSDVHHMVVCTLCSCYPRALLGPPPDWYKSLPYRSRAVSDPRGVLRRVRRRARRRRRAARARLDRRHPLPRHPAPPGRHRGPDRGRARRARHARRDDRRRPAGRARDGGRRRRSDRAQATTARRSRHVARAIATPANASRTATCGRTSAMPPPCSQELREGVVGPRVRRDVRGGATDDGKTSSGTIEPPRRPGRARAGAPTGPACCSVEHERCRAASPRRCQPGRRRGRRLRRRAGRPSRRRRRASSPRTMMSACRRAIASRPRSVPAEDRARRGRRREHPARDAEAPCLDQPDRTVERGEEDEQQQLRARAALEAARLRAGTRRRRLRPRTTVTRGTAAARRSAPGQRRGEAELPASRAASWAAPSTALSCADDGRLDRRPQICCADESGRPK